MARFSIANVLAILASNPGLLLSIPGAVTSLVNLVRAVVENPTTPEDVKKALDQWEKELDDDLVTVANAPVPE